MYILVLDVNFDGEVFKEYFVFVGDGFRMNKLGEFVFMVFSKMYLKIKEF